MWGNMNECHKYVRITMVLVICFTHAWAFRFPVPGITEDSAIIAFTDDSRLTRQKREVEQFPDRAKIRISFGNLAVDLIIQKTNSTGFAPCVFVQRRGQIVQHHSPVLQVGIYQDVSTGGAFLLRHRPSNLSIDMRHRDDSSEDFELFGSFQADNDQFVVQPSSDHMQGHVVSKIPQETLVFDRTPPRESFDRTVSVGRTTHQRSRFRRQTKNYAIELLSVVDYKSYMFWYNLTSGSSDRHTDTVANIMEYMTYMVNAMDVRYKSISGEPFTISVLNSGVFIADSPEASPWSVTKVTDGWLPSDEGLTAFTEWVKSQTGLPKHDHVMGFTGYDVTSMTSGTDSSGIAGLRVLCTEDSTSLVEDRFNFITMTTAAHELGHSLGAIHDGTGNSCPSSDNYIMASSNNIVLAPALASHPWRFSQCSVEGFKDYIHFMDGAGINCMLSAAAHSKEATTSRPMADVYPPDATCINRFGAGSFVCRSIQDYSALCRSMFCNQPNTTQCYAVIPAEGTVCGRGKCCEQGQCVTSSRAPSNVSDNCPIGDRPGLFEATVLTCAEYIESNPGNCYNNYTQTSCCESCNKKEKQNPDCQYGDHGTFCSGIQRFSCYSNENYCCETCPKLKNSSLPGCEFGDRLTGCQKIYCPYYSDQDRAGCCETCYDPSRPPPATTATTTSSSSTTTPQPTTKTTIKPTPAPTMPPQTTPPPTTTTKTTSKPSSTSAATASTPQPQTTTTKPTPPPVTSVTAEATPESTHAVTTTTTETKTLNPNAIEQDIVPVAIGIGIGAAVAIVVITTVCCVFRRVRRGRQEKLAVKDGSFDNIGFMPHPPSPCGTSLDHFRPPSDASHGSTIANGSLVYADGYMMPAPSVISETSVQYTAPNKPGFLATLKHAKLLRGSHPPSPMKPPFPDASKRVSRPVHYKRATGTLTGTLTNQSRPESVETSPPLPGFSGEVKSKDSDTYDSIGDVLKIFPQDRRPTLPENHPRNLNQMIKKFEQIQSSAPTTTSSSQIGHLSKRAGTTSAPPHVSGNDHEYNMPASPTSPSAAAPTPSPRHKSAASHSLPPLPTQCDNSAYSSDHEHDQEDPPPRPLSHRSVDSHTTSSPGEHPHSISNDSYLISQQLERPKTRIATTEQRNENTGIHSSGKSDAECVRLPPNKPVPRRQSSSDVPGQNLNNLPLKQISTLTPDNLSNGRPDTADVTNRHSSEIGDGKTPIRTTNKPVPRRQTSRGNSNSSLSLSSSEQTPTQLPRGQSSSENSNIAASASDQKIAETPSKFSLLPPNGPVPRRQSSSDTSGTSASVSMTTSNPPEGTPDGHPTTEATLAKRSLRPPNKPVPRRQSSSDNSNNSMQTSNQITNLSASVQPPSSKMEEIAVKTTIPKIPLRPPNKAGTRRQSSSVSSNQTAVCETSDTTNPTPSQSLSGLQSSATEPPSSGSNAAPYPPRQPLPRRQSSNAPKESLKPIPKPDVFEI